MTAWRIVHWADEEGARFGKSLFGSSACSGTLDLALGAVLRTVGVERHALTFRGQAAPGKSPCSEPC